ncbi:MAG: ferredoxin--NADP reductase, partial [Legionellales bacterium]|nr:ferredoxin--NADP reductase [Legionellales bacterium]
MRMCAMPIQQFSMTLVRTTMIAPHVKHFAFQIEPGKALDFIPGQFITLQVPTTDKTLRRSYSIASIPGQSDFIEFAAGYVEGGPATQFLFNLEPGAQVRAIGPAGRLILREEDQPQRYILVATSTGVTPFRSMLMQLAQRLQNFDLQVVLLLGVQHQADLIYAADFIEFAHQHPNFEFRAQYSRETLTEPKPYEHEGYVQQTFDELNLHPTEDIVYLCGNPD